MQRLLQRRVRQRIKRGGGIAGPQRLRQTVGDQRVGGGERGHRRFVVRMIPAWQNGGSCLVVQPSGNICNDAPVIAQRPRYFFVRIPLVVAMVRCCRRVERVTRGQRSGWRQGVKGVQRLAEDIPLIGTRQCVGLRIGGGEEYGACVIRQRGLERVCFRRAPTRQRVRQHRATGV